MADLEKVISGLEHCRRGPIGCQQECLYKSDFGCRSQLAADALELLKEQKRENEMTPFDVLNAISSAYGGKQIFFQENNGMIYDRYEADYVTLEEAVYRMARRVGDDGD